MSPKNDKLEHDIQNEIRLWCGEHNLLAIRINVGLFRDLHSERVINSGPPKGWPDLQILDNNGKIIFCECKAKYGRLRDDQKILHNELKKRNFNVIVPRSLEDFVKEMERIKYD